MSSLSLPVLIGLIVVALAFDFLNGVHDTANSIATLVSTRMLRPRYAVMWAAFFNFIAFLVFGVHVARTIGVGIVSADVMDAQVIFGALTGAILWNLITWWAGIPSSSSHALIGGLVGAGLTKSGVSAIVWTGLLTTGAFIALSPLFGFLLALALILTVSWAFVRTNPRTVEPIFQWLQFAAASLISLGHGGNDAQKTMGILPCSFLAGAARRRVLRAVLGSHHLPGCYWARHVGRRLADRTDRGVKNYANDASAGLLRLGRRRHHAVRSNLFGNSGLYHPHRYRFCHRRRCGAQSLCGSLEHRRQYRHRLDRDIAGFRAHGRTLLRRAEALFTLASGSRCRMHWHR